MKIYRFGPKKVLLIVFFVLLALIIGIIGTIACNGTDTTPEATSTPSATPVSPSPIPQPTNVSTPTPIAIVDTSKYREDIEEFIKDGRTGVTIDWSQSLQVVAVASLDSLKLRQLARLIAEESVFYGIDRRTGTPFFAYTKQSLDDSVEKLAELLLNLPMPTKKFFARLEPGDIILTIQWISPDGNPLPTFAIVSPDGEPKYDSLVHSIETAIVERVAVPETVATYSIAIKDYPFEAEIRRRGDIEFLAQYRVDAQAGDIYASPKNGCKALVMSQETPEDEDKKACLGKEFAFEDTVLVLLLDLVAPTANLAGKQFNVVVFINGKELDPRLYTFTVFISQNPQTQIKIVLPEASFLTNNFNFSKEGGNRIEVILERY